MERANANNLEAWMKVGLIFAVSSSVLGFFSFNRADPDLWGYMSFGRLFWQSQKFPYQDVFSYTLTLNPWVYHEWLTGMLFYPLYQALGAPGLQVLKYALGLATMALMYLTARVRGTHPVVAALFVVIISTSVRYGYFPVRAQVFTFFLFALFLYVLERARLSGRWRGLWLLPVLQIPWCNLHGGFPAGLGLIAFYAAGEFLSRRPYRPFLLIFLLCILVTLINPYGVTYWEYMARAVTMPRPYITEWTSLFWAYKTGLVNLAGIIYLLGLVFIGLLGMWQSRWREVTASLALAVTLYLGLKHIRHLVFWYILAGAYLPVCLNVNVKFLQSCSGLTKLWHLKRTKIVVLALLVFLTLVNLFLFIDKNPFSLRFPEKPDSQEDEFSIFYPVGAVNFINKQGLSGKILTRFEWGEYLIWELFPEVWWPSMGAMRRSIHRKLKQNILNSSTPVPGGRSF